MFVATISPQYHFSQKVMHLIKINSAVITIRVILLMLRRILLIHWKK